MNINNINNGNMDPAESRRLAFERRCKLCQLIHTNPELYKDIHSQILELGMSNTRGVHYINERIESEHLQLPLFNKNNFDAHFGSHITIEDKVNKELSKLNPSSITARPVTPEVGQLVEDMVRRKVGNEVNDYLNMDQLRIQLQEKADLIDTIIEKKDENGNQIIDKDAIETFTRIIDRIRNIIVDLNKIRQSRQIISNIMQSTVEKLSMKLMRQFMAEFDNIQQQIESLNVDPIRLNNIIQTSKVNIASILGTTAREVMSEIIMAYKLGTK